MYYLTGNLIKAGRGLAGIDQHDLADISDLSIGTIRNLEAYNERLVKCQITTLRAIVGSFQELGVCFIGQEDGRLGVQLMRPRSKVHDD